MFSLSTVKTRLRRHPSGLIIAASSETRCFKGDGKGRERLGAGKKERGGEAKGKGKGDLPLSPFPSIRPCLLFLFRAGDKRAILIASATPALARKARKQTFSGTKIDD